VLDSIPVAVQLTVADGPHDQFLPFLKKLSSSEPLRREYNELKKRCDGKPMTDYRDEKNAFIQAALADETIPG